MRRVGFIFARDPGRCTRCGVSFDRGEQVLYEATNGNAWCDHLVGGTSCARTVLVEVEADNERERRAAAQAALLPEIGAAWPSPHMRFEGGRIENIYGGGARVIAGFAPVEFGQGEGAR